MRSTIVRLGVLATLLIASAGLCQAAGTDDAQQLLSLVETAPPKGKSRLAIQQELSKAAPEATADFRVRLAYGYALIHERKYLNATTVVSAVAAEQPERIAPRQAKAWLLLASNKPSEALPELDAIARLLALPAIPRAVEKERTDVIPFLGTALAFCEGPAAAQVDGAALKQTKDNVLKALNAAQRAILDEQAKAVAELSAELKAAAEGHKAKKGEVDDAAPTKLAELDKAAQAVKAENDKIAADLKKQYGQLTAEYARFNAAHSQLTTELTATQAGLAKLQSKMSASKASPKNGKGHAPTSQQTNGQLNDTLATLSATIAKLNTSIEESTARGKAIEEQIARTRHDGQEVGANFDELNKSLGLKKPKAPRQKNKAKVAKTPVVKPPPAPAVERDKAFVNYYEFPYDTAKRQLLESWSTK